MKQQIAKRLGALDIRDIMERFCNRCITAQMACDALGVGHTRLYELRTSYLKASASNQGKTWEPGLSGGSHKPEWAQEVKTFIESALRCKYSYAFVASEVLRQFGVSLHRSQIRKYAIANRMANPPRKPHLPAHLRRWQRQFIGELWQLDATSEAWWEGSDVHKPMLNMLDDCSRMHVGCTMYAAENLAAYYHLFKTAFEEFGLPLRIYVDQAGFFTNHREDGLTALEKRLRIFDVSFVLANSPEAKGKVERIHQVWQQRLPPYFKLNGITPKMDLETVNEHLMSLREHRNQHELHREIDSTPAEAWSRALSEKRSKLRPAPVDHPWWELAWATYSTAMVGERGRVRFGKWMVPVQRKPGMTVWIATHTDGSFTILARPPFVEKYPMILYTTNIRLMPNKDIAKSDSSAL